MKRFQVFAFSSNGPFGILLVALPNSKSFGHKYAPSSGDVGCRPFGLSFSKLAISNKSVCNSEKVKAFSPTENSIARLTDLMRASFTPFCHGASAGVKIHCNPSMMPYSLIFFQSHVIVLAISSLLAAIS